MRPATTFTLREYSRSAIRHWRTALEAAVLVAEPALRSFEVRFVERVPVTQVSLADGVGFASPPNQVERNITVGLSSVVAGDLSDVYRSVASAAEAEATDRMNAMHGFLDGLTSATGQVDVEPGGLNWDAVMRVLDRLDIEISETGEPLFGLWPPGARTRYEALPPRTAVQEAAWQALIVRKREEARARSRHRRLR